MIVVTGGAGFIGSRLIHALNEKGYDNILVVDDLSDGKKFKNLVDVKFLDYMDKDVFLKNIQGKNIFSDSIQAIFHQGACSTTTEWNGKFMLENNYEYSKYVLHYCLAHEIPFFYASSAAIYGLNEIFKEQPEFEKPLNVYGYSKLLFDQYVRRCIPQAKTPIIGLRYFNVYGDHEIHKASMMSVVEHFYSQLKQNGTIKIFSHIDGYKPGEQRRDFVYVNDVAKVNVWCFEECKQSGIFNVGTGRSETFNQVAETLIAQCGSGQIQYEPLPEHLKGCYQAFTEADITALRKAGYEHSFKTVAEAIKEYIPVSLELEAVS